MYALPSRRMEPRVSMSSYAVVFTVAVAALVASDYSGTVAAWLGVGVLLVGVMSRLRLYHLTRRNEPPAHRKILDRLVVLQWSLAGIAAIAAGGASHYVDYR